MDVPQDVTVVSPDGMSPHTAAHSPSSFRDVMFACVWEETAADNMSEDGHRESKDI